MDFNVDKLPAVKALKLFEDEKIRLMNDYAKDEELTPKIIDKIKEEANKNLPLLYEKAYNPDAEKIIENKQKIMPLLRECYEKIIQAEEYYMDLPDDAEMIIALWSIGTYMIQLFSTFPLLFINATKGSGKTRQLRLLNAICKNGEILSSVRENHLFREAQEGHTLILDELENIKNKDMESVRQILNTCYKKGGQVTRSDKVRIKDDEGNMREKYIKEIYKTFTPVCMANINGMDEVVGDRCIPLILEKSGKQEVTKIIENFESNAFKELKELLDKISVWCVCMDGENIIHNWNYWVKNRYNSALTSHSIHTIHTLHTIHTIHYLEGDRVNIFNAKPKKEDNDFFFKSEVEDLFLKMDEAGLDGRNLEIFFPLIIISRMIGEDVFLEFLEVVKRIVTFKKEEDISQSKDMLFLSFIAKRGLTTDYVSVRDLLREFRDFNGDESSSWLNAEWIGLALRRLGLVIERKRDSKGWRVVINQNKAIKKLKMFDPDDAYTKPKEPKDLNT